MTTTKSNGGPAVSAGTESVAQILERQRDPLIHEWLALVEKQEDLMAIPLNYEDRTGHLSAVASRRDRPAPSRFLYESSYLHRGQSSRRSAAQTGLLGGHGGGRIALVAGLPFLHSA